MSRRVLNIPAGVAFLPALADALLEGRLVPDFSYDGDPLKLADVTIYVPTRRAARVLRSVFVDRLGGVSAILPTIHPMGEFDEDADIFEGGNAEELELNPPIGQLDRLLFLAPLVQAWKRRLPAHVEALFGEEVVVPASLSDAIWLARDLTALMDEIETNNADWNRLADLVPTDLANWWQVTLEFLEIVTRAWPALLAERERSNPAAHRSAMIMAEAERLLRSPPKGPIIVAGSTGSIPATAKLLTSIASLPLGAVVLPGLDKEMDAHSWDEIGSPEKPPASFGHPQATLKKLLGVLGIDRSEVQNIATAPTVLADRIDFLCEALLPAESTDEWFEKASRFEASIFDGVTLVEAANEREEALSIAIALRLALEEGTAALVTSDRDLGRRVAAELRRFGIDVDDSGGTPLSATPPATLLRLMLETVFRPGDAVTIMSLLKHPLLRCSLPRARVREAAETIDLIALRGGTGRPDIANLRQHFEDRLAAREENLRKPAWWSRISPSRLEAAREVLATVEQAIEPLQELRKQEVDIATLTRLTIETLEVLGRDEDDALLEFYRGDAGEKLASFLRSLLGVEAELSVYAGEWPDVFGVLISGESVKASAVGDNRVPIWGALEARLQSVDTLVLGGLNEGSWPRRAEPDRFMSRFMKSGMELEPPEKRIGQAAHDFIMAMGTPKIIMTRAARSGDAPAIASRWLQRLKTLAGKEKENQILQKGAKLLHWAREMDKTDTVLFAERPNPKPPVSVRPTRFSVTEVETLRRDAYAVYAKRILGLELLEPLLRDPGAAERGTLFHDVVHAFSEANIDAHAPDAVEKLIKIGREKFDEIALPPDIDAVWWPRFVRMAEHFIAWERKRPESVKQRIAETRAKATPVGATGISLSGRADRVDIHAANMADIIDFKTGSSPSKAQAHTLVSPQLALEGALLMRGAFEEAGANTPADLIHVRMRPDGRVEDESILEYRRQIKSAQQLSEEAWARLESLFAYYLNEKNGYLSRALPFKEGDVGGDYDHLARVLEWSAGGDGNSGGGDAE